MKKTMTCALLTGLLATVGIAHAQDTGATATNTMPARAGEASTLTQGVPNAPKAVSANSRAEVQARARLAVLNGTTSHGTIGTADHTGQQAGLEPLPTDGKTREELKAEYAMLEARRMADLNLAAMSTAGMSTGVPAGNPSPQFGAGTPK